MHASCHCDQSIWEIRYGGWPKGTLRAGVAAFLSLEALLVAVCVLWRRRPLRKVWWLLAIVLTFSLVYCLTHAQVRFRMPTEPILAVINAVVLCEMVGTVQEWRLRRVRPTSAQPAESNA